MVAKDGEVKIGHSVVTDAGRMTDVRYIIHAVGPSWRDGKSDEDALLRDTVMDCLVQAETLGLKSIAFPPISAGNLGFPKEGCAVVFAGAILTYFDTKPNSTVQQVYLTMPDEPTFTAFRTEFDHQRINFAGGETKTTTNQPTIMQGVPTASPKHVISGNDAVAPKKAKEGQCCQIF